jgi:hypothetical protein
MLYGLLCEWLWWQLSRPFQITCILVALPVLLFVDIIAWCLEKTGVCGIESADFTAAVLLFISALVATIIFFDCGGFVVVVVVVVSDALSALIADFHESSCVLSVQLEVRMSLTHSVATSVTAAALCLACALQALFMMFLYLLRLLRSLNAVLTACLCLIMWLNSV